MQNTFSIKPHWTWVILLLYETAKQEESSPDCVSTNDCPDF